MRACCLALLVGCVPGPEDGGRAGAPDDTDDTGDSGCLPVLVYVDADGDGFGSAEAWHCEPPADTAVQGGDCDDSDGQVFPGAVEICNGLDDDCDGVIDPDAVLSDLHPDADGDGHGNGAVSVRACPEAGLVEDGCDCDDQDPTVAIDLLACPPVSCPPDGGIWERQECAPAIELSHEGVLVVDHAAALTLCPGTHDVQIQVQADRVQVWGTDRQGTVWQGGPALVVQQADSLVEIDGLQLGGSGSSAGGFAGQVIDAGASGASLHIQDADVGLNSIGTTSMNFVSVGGDLEMVDATLGQVRLAYGDAYSTSCTHTGVKVQGDLHLTGVDLVDFSFECSSWSHSAYNEHVAVGVDVAGDALLDDVRITEHIYQGASSGSAAASTFAALRVGGSLTAQDLWVADNALQTTVYCTRSECWRTQLGGVVWAKGSVDWTGGGLEGDAVSLEGTQSYGIWSDVFAGAPLYWTGGETDSLVLTDVTLDPDVSPDVSGTADFDGAGVVTVACDSAGCN